MENLGAAADQYQSHTTRNIADLEIVNVDMQVYDREGKDKEGKPFKYKVVVVDGEDYRIPASVLKQIQAMRKRNPNLQKFNVAKSGTGMGTNYQVIPL